MPLAMPLRDFHPCQFGFHTSNIRILSGTVSGGRSLSGFEDSIEADGGGYRACDLSNGLARTREQNMAIRALVDEVGTSTPLIVRLCMERHFQPTLGRVGVRPNTPIADDAPDKGASYAASAGASLRATSMLISGTSELALIGGELFSIQHDTWGWRVYRITSVTPQGSGYLITFRTPLREAIDAGTALEFDNPRCQMRFTQVPDFPTDDGLRTTLALTLTEDMRPPS